MNGTSGSHNGMAKAGFPVANFVFDNPKALNAADSMFDTDTQGRECVIGEFLPVGQRGTFRLFLGLKDGYLV
jgi:hypothetical protein